MNNQEIKELTLLHVAQTYARFPIALVRGKGVKVWDADGKEYLDFVGGIAVDCLGHGHPAVLRALRQQSRDLIHVSNLYHIGPQAELARDLCRHSFADRVFFCNSGAEANEAAIKLARRYGWERLGGKYEILSMLNSFHGRTLATLTATGQEKVRLGYDPLPQGFRQVPFGDVSAVEEAIGEKTAAVLVEPIQGEGGIVLPPEGYLRELRELCNARRILLIFDEVQVGMGRTGRLFAYEHYGVEPDIMTLAKALGGGLPLGAMLAKEEVARSFVPGTHASTFGGNPLVCAVGGAVLQTLVEGSLLENCARMGAYLTEGLRSLQTRFGFIREVRGKGLIVGVEVEREAGKIVAECLEAGLLILGAGNNNVLRFLPALTVKKKDVARALALLEKVLGRH